MKILSIILSAGVLILASCSTGKQQNSASKAGQLTAKMAISPLIQSADSLQLSFTVYNQSARTQQFCKWFTPFEPPMSKYLNIKDEQGTEVEYRGAMAKRIMPPPADSYIKIKPGDSLSIKVDISKIYPLDKPGKYTVTYNAQEMSGLLVPNAVSFLFEQK